MKWLEDKSNDKQRLTCSECKSRHDVPADNRTRTKRSFCGQKIPMERYPVFGRGAAPYWCPKRERHVSPLLSGVSHVRMDYDGSWRCSLCGTGLKNKRGVKHCPECEKEYVGDKQ